MHEQIEKENQAKKIIDHSIALEEYKLLLLQNYIAYRTVEKQIARFLPDYEAAKHKQLEKDLTALDVATSIALEYEAEFSCNNKTEALGAAYVVEGSALGGMVISKELKECTHLNGIGEQHFFSGDRANVKSWNKFKKELDSHEYSEDEKEQATQKAKETFQFFGKIFSKGKGELLTSR